MQTKLLKDKKKLFLIGGLVAVGLVIVLLIVLSNTPKKQEVNKPTSASAAKTSSTTSATSSSSQTTTVPITSEEDGLALKVLAAEVNTPTVKMLDTSEFRDKSYKLVQDMSKYDAYSIIVSAVIHYNQSYKLPELVLTNVPDNMYEIVRHETYLTEEEQKAFSDKLPEQVYQVSKMYYVIKYAVPKGTNPDIELKFANDISIINISKNSYNGVAKTSGTVTYDETFMFKDEYGATNYFIMVSDGSARRYQAFKATEINSYGYAYYTFSFRFVHISDYAGLSNNLYLDASKNTKVIYPGYTYKDYNSPNADHIVVIKTHTGSNPLRIHRYDGVLYNDIRLVFMASDYDNSLINDFKTLKVKFYDFDLTFDHLDW